jgi:uncharacterized protein with von Willebrand factor type A (vWA) domain
VLDVIAKDGYDLFSYDGAKRSLSDLAGLESDGAKTNECWPPLLSDLYSALYKAKPERLEGSDAPEAHKRLVDQTIESLDYDAMRQTTRLNKVGAAIGTLELGEALLSQLPEGEPKRDPNDANDAGWDYLKGCSNQDDQGRAMRRMVRAAKKRTTETMETLQALGWGEGEGSGEQSDLAEAAKLSRKLRQDDSLRRIAQLAGRMRRMALAKRNTRLKRQPEEVVGVELGRDISQAIPSELALLASPLRLLVLDRWSRGQLVVYEKEGQEKLGQGPIVCVVDCSGSMRGERDVWSKAVCLGLLAIAQREKREFAIVFFNSSTTTYTFSSKATMAQVMAAMSHGCSGGTNFERALSEGMSVVEKAETADDPLKRADLVCITDGDCRVSDAFAASYQKRAAATAAHLYTVYIGTHEESLNALSDGVARISDLSNDSQALELAFGI